MGSRGRQIPEFKASLVYRDRIILRNPLWKRKKKKKNVKNQTKETKTQHFLFFSLSLSRALVPMSIHGDP